MTAIDSVRAARLAELADPGCPTCGGRGYDHATGDRCACVHCRRCNDTRQRWISVSHEFDEHGYWERCFYCA